MAQGDIAQGVVRMDKRAVKRDRTPLSPDTWQGKIRSNKAEIRRSKDKGPNAIPYVAFALEALDSAPPDGGPNKMVYHNLFLLADPNSAGMVQYEGADAFLGLCNSIGETPEMRLESQTVETDEGNQKKSFLNPRQVLDFIKRHDGAVISFKSRIEHGSKNKDTGQVYSDKAVVDYFIAKEDAEGGESSSDTPQDDWGVSDDSSEGASSDDSASTSMDDGEGEEVVEEPPAPAPKPSKPASAKPSGRPASKRR